MTKQLGTRELALLKRTELTAIAKAEGRRNRDELAFLPAALEIVETPPSPTARWTTVALLSLISITIAWSVLSKVDVVAVAEGKVIPKGQVKLVQPLEPGIVRALHVAEGDRVEAGQVLIEIDPTEQKANLEQARYDRLQALFDAESARVLLTESPDTPFEVPLGANALIAEAVKQQTRDSIAKYVASVSSFVSQIEEKSAERDANAVALAKNESTRPLLEERFHDLKGLADKGLAQADRWQKARQDMIDGQAEVEALEQKTAQINAEIRSLEAKRRETQTSFRADASDKRLKALQKVVQLEQQIAKEEQRDKQRRLVAPVTGTVLSLKANTIGGVVTAADTLMTIVPEDTVIEVDAKLVNRDVGYVHVGQEVAVKLETYTFTRYGTVAGHVRTIGRDSVKPEADPSHPSNSTELVYPVRVALDRTTMLVDGLERPITPGMKVTAEIKTDERRVISFLLDQVLGTLWTAGRER